MVDSNAGLRSSIRVYGNLTVLRLLVEGFTCIILWGVHFYSIDCSASLQVWLDSKKHNLHRSTQ